MRWLPLLVALCPACGVGITLEEPQGGYRMRVHGSLEATAACLERLDGIRPDGSGLRNGKRYRGFLWPLPEGSVDLCLVRTGHGSELEVMSRRPKLSAGAVLRLEEALRSCGLASEPVDLGALAR